MMSHPRDMLDVCVAGVTGNVGRRVAAAILDAPDLRLVAAVGRSAAGIPLARLLDDDRADAPVSATIDDALATPSHVVVDYTKPAAVGGHVRAAIRAGRHVVIGTSGLTDEDYDAIDALARDHGVGVFAAGNFSLTAALLVRLAAVVARHVPHWEIIDYGPDAKPDAPSGTARELAHQLGQVSRPRYAVPPGAVQGDPATRGGTHSGQQLHAVRVPGFYSTAEVIFGLPGERLSLRHDSMSYEPYVSGTLLATKHVGERVGLRRGLAQLLDTGL